MFEYTRVTRQYLLILIARGWKLSVDLSDELQYSGSMFFNVIIHNNGKWKNCITGLK